MDIESVHDLQIVARARRRELGLTQAATAARAGVSRKWLSAFEHGATAAELPLVLRLLAVLDLRIDVGPATSPRVDTDQRDGTLTEDMDVIDLEEHLRGFRTPLANERSPS
jgi:transcriptional regulator with XRE-family HTH domain